MSDNGVDGAASGPVRFVLFGGARIMREGIPIEVRQPKQRGLLGLLMANPGTPVTLADAIDTLWPGQPAVSVTNQVHRHVGALRRLCEPSLQRRAVGRYILPAGNGYRLAVDEAHSDVLRFRRLVRDAYQRAEAGDRQQALSSYRAALELASGPAGDERQIRLPTFVGLEDERVAAISAAIGLCERAEDFSALLPVVRAATARHPLDETLHAALMHALTGTGRAGDALEVYAQIRSALAEELGGSPGAALQAAQSGALRTEDGRDPPHVDPNVGSRDRRRIPAQLPLQVPGFAGRRDLLAALYDDETHAQRADGRPTLLLISGMAGVGKTTFALRHAAELASRYPDGQLYVNLRGFDAAAVPIGARDALGDMLEGLGIPAQVQAESVDARAGLLRTTLSERRVLVVLDNAHDYRQIEPLLPGTGPSRVIITSRNQMPALTAFHQAATIQLDPFDNTEIVEFFHQRLPLHRRILDTAAMIQIGRACGGLPLALAIVTARASANPDLPLALLAHEITGQSPLASLNAGSAELDLRTVFSWSLRGLSDDAARTFAALSIHPGPDISTAAAASLSGLDLARTREVLTELTLASALREPRPGRFVFHDLVREYALTLLGDRAADMSARLINHYVRSTRQAILTFGRPPLAPVEEMPGIIAETFASSRAAKHWYTTERRVLHQVCRLADDLGDHRSVVLLILDWRPMSQAVDSSWATFPFAKLAVNAVEQLGEASLRAETYRNAATSHAHAGQLEAAHRYFDLAAAAFDQSGDLAGLANLQRNIGMTLPMSHPTRIKHLRTAVDIARDIDNRALLATSLTGLAAVQNWAGEHNAALATVEEATETIAPIPGGVSGINVFLLTHQVNALAGAGRLREAADVADHALPIIRREGEVGAERALLMSYGDVLTALGRRHDAAQAWRRLLSLISGPENAQELLEPGDDTNGTVIIDRIKTKLASLV
jgi:DNA-binding SARP family transcriptional activator/tetratricopeptide (TPR) repeat protein